MMEGEDDSKTRKEEDDKAWWSDYQASTKLRRKLIKTDLDDFDDILGDLDDIVKRTDIKAEDSRGIQSQTSATTEESQSANILDTEGKNLLNILNDS